MEGNIVIVVMQEIYACMKLPVGGQNPEWVRASVCPDAMNSTAADNRGPSLIK
jgi:hypothetical protein